MKYYKTYLKDRKYAIYSVMRCLKAIILRYLFAKKAIHRKCECGEVLSEYFITDVHNDLWIPAKYVMWHPGFCGCGLLSEHRRHKYKCVFGLWANCA